MTLQHGVRIAGDQQKITTHFFLLEDLIREANYWARKETQKVVSRKHVNTAIAEKIKRLNLLEEKIHEKIEDGTILIDTSGKKVGTVNGLVVYSLGDYNFGKPSRITAVTGHSLESNGIINIERESKLSGSSYNKGVLIIGGYIRHKYAQHQPVQLSASICFEQSYGMVDGRYNHARDH